MSTYAVPQGQEDLKIKVTLVEDGAVVNISSASVLNLKLWKPSGTIVAKSASLLTDGTDGVLYAVTASTDLDEIGWYSVRAYIEQGTFKGHSAKGKFLVEAL